MAQSQEAGQEAMSVGGELGRNQSVVATEFGKKRRNGEAEAETDTNVVKADEPLRGIEDGPVPRSPVLDIGSKEGLDQPGLRLGNNREARVGVPYTLILTVAAIDGIGLGRSDGGRNHKPGPGGRSNRVLSNPQSINDGGGGRRGRGRGDGHRVSGGGGRRRRDGRHSKRNQREMGGKKGRNEPGREDRETTKSWPERARTNGEATGIKKRRDTEGLAERRGARG